MTSTSASCLATLLALAFPACKAALPNSQEAALVPSATLFHRIQKPRTPSDGKAPVLILLHGVGSNEHDLMGLAPHLDGRFFTVSVRAPNTLGPGAYGWFRFDVQPDGSRMVDLAQAESSRVQLLALLDTLVAQHPDVDPSRIYLAGFSQGAIMGASLVLTQPTRFKGLVMMSGRILPEVLARHAPDEQLRGFPVLVVHGTRDGVLPVDNGRASRDAWSALPVTLTYREFPMAHEVSAASLAEVTGWLTRALDGKVQ
jgi:phospholipase/carboxylesterase